MKKKNRNRNCPEERQVSARDRATTSRTPNFQENPAQSRDESRHMRHQAGPARSPCIPTHCKSVRGHYLRIHSDPLSKGLLDLLQHHGFLVIPSRSPYHHHHSPCSSPSLLLLRWGQRRLARFSSPIHLLPQWQTEHVDTNLLRRRRLLSWAWLAKLDIVTSSKDKHGAADIHLADVLTSLRRASPL